MHCAITWLAAHATTVSFLGWYLYSAAMNQMPALPENAGFFTKWFHDTLQFLAANPAKFSRPGTPIQAPVPTQPQQPVRLG
jgi:hypothetical protein